MNNLPLNVLIPNPSLKSGKDKNLLLVDDLLATQALALNNSTSILGINRPDVTTDKKDDPASVTTTMKMTGLNLGETEISKIKAGKNSIYSINNDLFVNNNLGLGYQNGQSYNNKQENVNTSKSLGETFKPTATSLISTTTTTSLVSNSLLLDPTAPNGKSSGIVTDDLNHNLFFAFTNLKAQGTGNIKSFLRLQESDRNKGIQSGFNTNGKLEFDTKKTSTRAIKLSEFSTVTIDGINYYEFRIDVNENDNRIDLTKLQVFLSNQSNLTGYNNNQLAGLNPVINLNSDVQLNPQLNSGSGSGDLLVYLPQTALGTNGNNYVYIYSEFANAEAGFEEFSVGKKGALGAFIDLGITKTFDLNTVTGVDNNNDNIPEQFMALPADIIRYNLTITNDGCTDATGVKLLDDLTQKLPIGLNFLRFIDLDGGTSIDTDYNNNTVEVLFSKIKAGQSKTVTIEAQVSTEFIKTFDFKASLGIIDPLIQSTNVVIPEYHEILLEGEFYLSLDFTKLSGDKGIEFNHLKINNTATVSANEIDTNLSNNSIDSRLDISSFNLSANLNNDQPLEIRSIQPLGVTDNSAYFLDPDPVLLNGEKIVQFNLSNKGTSTNLTQGGTANFLIREVNAGIDGKYGTTDDNFNSSYNFSIVDGSNNDETKDLDNTINSQISTEWFVPQSLVGKVFQVQAQAGTRTYTAYFDSNGLLIPSDQIATTINSNNFFSNLVLSVGAKSSQTLSSNTGTAYPTWNHSSFLPTDGFNGDLLNAFGGSFLENIWQEINDPQYLANIATWRALGADGNISNLAESTDEQQVLNYLYDHFIETGVFSFNQFAQASFSLLNQATEQTTIELMNAEIAPKAVNFVDITVKDGSVILNGTTNFCDLETALNSLCFTEPTGVKIKFSDTNCDGIVKTRLENLTKGYNFEKNWYVEQILIDSNVTEKVILYTNCHSANIDLSFQNIQFANPDQKALIVIRGANGQDHIVGSKFNDRLEGSCENDDLSGLNGDDILIGGKGSDRLVGGRGNDLLIGNDHYNCPERDEFVFGVNFGSDIVTDFDNQDQINLTGLNISSISELDTNHDGIINAQDAIANEVNGSLLIDLRDPSFGFGLGGGTILLQCVTQINNSAVMI